MKLSGPGTKQGWISSRTWFEERPPLPAIPGKPPSSSRGSPQQCRWGMRFPSQELFRGKWGRTMVSGITFFQLLTWRLQFSGFSKQCTSFCPLVYCGVSSLCVIILYSVSGTAVFFFISLNWFILKFDWKKKITRPIKKVIIINL